MDLQAVLTNPHLWIMAAAGVALMLAALLLILLRRQSSLKQRMATLSEQRDELRLSEARLSEKLSAATSAQATAQSEHAAMREELDKLRGQRSEWASERAVMQTQLHEQDKAAKDKIALLQQAEERLKREFENLANKIFDAKSEKFTQQSKSSVEALLNPVREQLKDFRRRVEDVYDKESKDRVSLFSEIKHLKSLNERISDEALNLTRALKGESKTRGDWGEIQLQRLLEDSGLQQGREYETQSSYRDAQGDQFRPDVVVHLPQEKDIMIDSKVSLAAYDNYYAAETDAARGQCVKAHISAVRTHIRQLSEKNYADLIGVNTLDLVVMFVPIEPALLLALQHESGLFREALDKRILLLGPTMLMGTLQIIHNIWRYEQQNRNAVEIARKAGDLHDKFVGFVEALDDIGANLDKARESYATARKRLTAGKGNLVTRTVALRKLGAKAKKTLPETLLADADEAELAKPPGKRPKLVSGKKAAD